MQNEILQLTKKLVSIGSVNTTPGEKEISCYIEAYLREIPYFKEHPDRIIIQKLKEDPLDRRNVIAWIKGEKGDNKDTIIFHGHTDTVGIDDFGALKEYAFDCDKLMEELKKAELPKEVKEDLESGDYLFGRGSCDMKSGDAVFMVIAKHICENLQNLNGNILLSFNPVEENLHTGMIQAGEVFAKFQKEGLNYLFAINNDYICPLYPEDTTKYIYTGSVGKLLPCFYIQGKETHVGQCYEGFDASMIASELVKIMNLNPDFCDGYKDEYTLPPSVLKIKDLKEYYNVQTSFASFVYFNYFIHNTSVTEVMGKLKITAKEAFENVLLLINERYKKYCKLTKIDYKKITYDFLVLSYEELVQKARPCYKDNLDEYIDNLTNQLMEDRVDKREIPLEIVKKLCNIANIKMPLIVIFFAAPYCPHNTLKSNVEEEKELYKKLSNVVNAFADQSGEKYEILQFFPSLSDSSYLKIDDDINSIDLLINNFPAYSKLYNVPLQNIKSMNIPGINYGCYGKDAHKYTERVYMPYSYEILPKLIQSTVDFFLR